MNDGLLDDFWDDLFHGCALAAYIDQAIQQGGPPDEEATRKRAFRYYEMALAEKNLGRADFEPGEPISSRANQAGGEAPPQHRGFFSAFGAAPPRRTSLTLLPPDHRAFAPFRRKTLLAFRLRGNHSITTFTERDSETSVPAPCARAGIAATIHIDSELRRSRVARLHYPDSLL